MHYACDLDALELCRNQKDEGARYKAFYSVMGVEADVSMTDVPLLKQKIYPVLARGICRSQVYSIQYERKCHIVNLPSKTYKLTKVM